MASEPRKPPKSESLTIRLNPRTRFVLEFVARMRGQTITTVVERALEMAGDQAKIPQDYGNDLTWKDFWDVSEGVRSLRIAGEAELFPTFEEERRREFVKQFWEYFFSDNQLSVPNRVYIDILWPRIDEFIDHHDNNKQRDYYSAEKMMRRALLNAKVSAPKSNAGVRDEKPNYDLDDDIPF